MKVRKTLLKSGNVHQLEAGMAVYLGLLEVQAGLGQGSHVLGEATPDESRRNKMPEGEPPRMLDIA
jgi:hypothetical protein